jgi:hypothetical protein
MKPEPTSVLREGSRHELGISTRCQHGHRVFVRAIAVDGDLYYPSAREVCDTCRWKDGIPEPVLEYVSVYEEPQRCVVCNRHFIGGALVETRKAVFLETDDLGPIPGPIRDESGQLWPWLRESGPRWVCSKQCARYLVIDADFDDLVFADAVYTGPEA